MLDTMYDMPTRKEWQQMTAVLGKKEILTKNTTRNSKACEVWRRPEKLFQRALQHIRRIPHGKITRMTVMNCHLLARIQRKFFEKRARKGWKITEIIVSHHSFRNPALQSVHVASRTFKRIIDSIHRQIQTHAHSFSRLMVSKKVPLGLWLLPSVSYGRGSRSFSQPKKDRRIRSSVD